MLSGVKRYLGSPWLLVPLLLALALFVNLRYGADPGARERAVGLRGEPAPGVSLLVERAWIGGQATVLRVEALNATDLPFELGGLRLRDGRGGSHALRASAEEPALTIAPHALERRDLVFDGRVDPAATRLDLVEGEAVLVAGIPTAPTAAPLGTAPPEASALLERRIDRPAELLVAAERAQAEAEEARARAEALTADLVRLDEERALLAVQLEEERGGQGARLDGIAGSVERTEGQIETFGGRIEELVARIDNLLAVRELSEATVAELEEELTRLREESEQEVTGLREELDVARGRAEELAASLDQQAPELEELDGLRASHAQAQEVVAGLRQELEAAIAARERLAAELDVVRGRAEELATRVDQQEPAIEELDALRAEHDRVQQVVAGLRPELEAAVMERGRLAAELEALQAEHDRMQEVVAGVRPELEAAIMERGRLAAELEAARAEAAEREQALQAEIERLQAASAAPGGG